MKPLQVPTGARRRPRGPGAGRVRGFGTPGLRSLLTAEEVIDRGWVAFDDRSVAVQDHDVGGEWLRICRPGDEFQKVAVRLDGGLVMSAVREAEADGGRSWRVDMPGQEPATGLQ